MHTNIDKIRTVSIENVIEESPSVKTFVFQDKLSSNAKPGQFLMVWSPRAEELPMSIMISNKKNHAAISVRKYGFGSTSLYEKVINDKIGIRGPYGNYFRVNKNIKNPLLIGGGTGLVPIIRLATQFNRIEGKCTVIIGSKSKNEVLFEGLANRILNKVKNRIIVTTEDGSYGIKGVVTDVFSNIIKKEKFDMIYTCGPELMMKKIYDLSVIHSIPIQVSLERYMKCGIGICASCCINDKLVCKDGTVFNEDQLSLMLEFGKIYRDKSGRKAYY
ncbi:MAG TPA: dihydroorotate dehydrogenase electron transfer subunit [Nitrososphaeraceae archaeon]|nr:dihydroorotate dehydrogenase electron transfer subunit [Nitrososphaeraceae archaeon]